MCGVFVEFLPIRVLVTELMANLYMCVCVSSLLLFFLNYCYYQTMSVLSTI